VTDAGVDPAAARERELLAEVRLRPERPPVTRLSRKVIAGLAAVGAIAVSGARIGMSQSPLAHEADAHAQ
jgi:type IV secretion system protein TrbI